ncbi:MAG: hypothetical protein GTO45_41085 [Candidatus Aminicenantes bacterium]|nr:hypothetical protein [Candidatus Aminicenantes bacterium]NIM85000.1 hypothetical protein [Candidatus Aminicenantes bacterium]NIN24514.1 hypothetical protein [Candidatus Aminicenantes bacterium]NIN48278.1 hypothetical protein [Candidatus Aminicenantes bacterium]NIN91181.1 hypothetical protein [Candidatus Aminicenantes bacterium]
MIGGFRNKPKILRGAFMEYGVSTEPLLVVFQFNPVQLTRNRSLTFTAPNEAVTAPPSGTETREEGTSGTRTSQQATSQAAGSLRNYHKDNELMDIQIGQRVTLQEESISFEIRLDATDQLNEGDPIAGLWGIAPQLSALELMVYPKAETVFGADLGSSGGHSFGKEENPPMIIFIWGEDRVLPVNINSMNITETEFNTQLSPIRATVSVSLTVIEGKNAVYAYSQAMKEINAMMNMANMADVGNVVIPE